MTFLSEAQLEAVLLTWARERGGLELFALAGELEPVAVTSRKGTHE
ncbi:hypothetical protein RM530_17445 [Algiphilus sp. W345]|uniref:Uncharacterized protein n=1 Tax=Banduia mediterranea TaxID=3075609 RepID=A0ABU2WMN0_9GAMM|nr:hypothetical protein [Algiphilus sp. W345]MDT0499131.1 hypothetical protein [Algiphilus sp. W345]